MGGGWEGGREAGRGVGGLWRVCGGGSLDGWPPLPVLTAPEPPVVTAPGQPVLTPPGPPVLTLADSEGRP